MCPMFLELRKHNSVHVNVPNVFGVTHIIVPMLMRPMFLELRTHNSVHANVPNVFGVTHT